MGHSASKTMLLVTVILMDLLTGMEFDLFVPSFPQLQHHFTLSPFWVEALLSINFIGYCGSLFFVGGLADRYGRKPIILLGLVIFIIGTLFCLFTHHYIFLILGRFFQGIGIAAPAILSFLIIADSYSLKEQQFLMAMLNGSLNVAAGIAPVIGSYLTLYFNWQGNFAALFLLGLIAFVMTFLFIPNSTLPAHEETLSTWGYKLVFQSKPLMLLIINLLLTFIPYWIFVGMSPLLYIKDLGVDLTHFGYYQGVLALVFALGSVTFGLMLKHFHSEQKRMLHMAMQILLFSLLILILMTGFNTHNPLFITGAMLIFVIAQIIPSTILYPFCVNFIPQAKGRVSAILQGGRLLFTALALQIAGYFYSGTFRNIGLIIIAFIGLAIVTLFLVMHNKTLMVE